MDNSQAHRRTEFQSTYIGLCLPSVVLQRDPATLRGSDSYLGVDTLLRRGVHDRGLYTHSGGLALQTASNSLKWTFNSAR